MQYQAIYTSYMDKLMAIVNKGTLRGLRIAIMRFTSMKN